jgi:hypothetical protein
MMMAGFGMGRMWLGCGYIALLELLHDRVAMTVLVSALGYFWGRREKKEGFSKRLVETNPIHREMAQ